MSLPLAWAVFVGWFEFLKAVRPCHFLGLFLLVGWFEFQRSVHLCHLLGLFLFVCLSSRRVYAPATCLDCFCWLV